MRFSHPPPLSPCPDWSVTNILVRLYVYLRPPSGRPLNKFNLQLGQWTDDCSMGLCIADSLLTRDGYDGSDVRVRFWNWWHRGYCNAFGSDLYFGPRSSVGLGGNMSKSLSTMAASARPTPRFESVGE